jgi:hypothetical protein
MLAPSSFQEMRVGVRSLTEPVPRMRGVAAAWSYQFVIPFDWCKQCKGRQEMGHEPLVVVYFSLGANRG